MRVGPLLAHLRQLEAVLAGDLRAAASDHADEHDVHFQCLTFAAKADERARELDPIAQRYGGVPEWATAVGHPGEGDLLSHLRVLRLRCDECALTWQMSVQAAKAARDQELLAVATACHVETEAHAKWFTTRIAAAAAQALVVG